MCKRAKNILFITSDQQHWATLGINNPEIETPNLDRLAAKGIVYDRAYTVNPTCTPTRASLITGTYPSQHGAYSLGTHLPQDVPTIGQYLKDAGYVSALVGKAHFQGLKSTDEYPSIESYPLMQDLDYWRKFHGPFYGFDHVELARNHTDEAHAGQHYAIWMEDRGLKNWRDYFLPPTGTKEKGGWLWDIPEEFHHDAWIADRSNALMEEYAEKDQPFFLWASFFDPHPACMVPAPWHEMYDPEKLTLPGETPYDHSKNPPHFQLTQEENPDFSAWQEPDGNGTHGFHSHLFDRKWQREMLASYYAMVSLMDKYIGIILDKLEELGLVEETLVVFTTDHGHFTGQHGLVAKGPFHYEDMIKVPFIVSQPGTVARGKRCDALQSLVDIAPSFLDWLGQSVPRTMTGLSQVAVWSGEKDSARDCVLVENHHQPSTIHVRTLVDQRWKLTVYFNQTYGEMFDLQEDPDEHNNLWDDPEFQEIKKELLLKLVHAEMAKDPMWMPRIWAA